jgi:hypothetical protein
MSTNTSFYIKDYGRLSFLEKRKSDYIEQNIILYGESGSGKTVLIREIMYIVKDDIPNIIIISPTENSNKSYSGLVPKSCIKESISVEELKGLYARQVEAKKTYLLVNDIDKLGKLFHKCAVAKEKHALDRIRMHFHQKIDRIKGEITAIEDQKMMINKLNELKFEAIKTLYKKVIEKNKRNLLRCKLTDDEKRIIIYLKFNHKIMIIFDDYSASAKQWAKDETVKKILFQGRHEGITFVIGIHNFTLLDTDIRTNAHLSIFASSTSANRYFSSSANGFSRRERDEAELIINGLWKKNDEKNYKKLVYQRNASDKFKYTIADIHDNFQFGSPYMWKFCAFLEKEEDMTFSNLFSLPT